MSRSLGISESLKKKLFKPRSLAVFNVSLSAEYLFLPLRVRLFQGQSELPRLRMQSVIDNLNQDHQTSKFFLIFFPPPPPAPPPVGFYVLRSPPNTANPLPLPPLPLFFRCPKLLCG